MAPGEGTLPFVEKVTSGHSGKLQGIRSPRDGAEHLKQVFPSLWQ